MTDIFHKEFYPTPLHVLEMMQLDCEGKTILEPHAGKGDIIDFCYANGAKKVLAYEINEDLQKVVKTKGVLLGGDFFECDASQVSHIDAIIMNPPFSNADKHILHAWEIAPAGCEIVALCNYATIERINSYRKLGVILRDHGISSNLGNCFSTAERTTNIQVGLIRLFKPAGNDFEFEGFFMDQDDQEAQGEGMIQYNEVRALVNRYVGAMKNFDRMKEQVDELNANLASIGVGTINMSLGYNESIMTKEEFSKVIQKRSWTHIFNKMQMSKFVTSGVMENINKFVETQSKYPFTMKNIYKMFEIIVGTRSETFNRALEEAIDNFTKHSHENRYGVEGWKTNSGYMLNKKFIIDGMMETSWGFRIRHGSFGSKKLDDLVKVLCNVTGKNYNDYSEIYQFNTEIIDGKRESKNIQSNTWYDWGFFEIKMFKKSTMHLKFKDLNDWYLLNKAYGELKGFALPEQYKK